MGQLDIVASTYKIRLNGQQGTSFMIEENSRRYLITAKHIGQYITDSVEMEWENGWLTIPIRIVGHSDDDTTVAYCEQDFARMLLPEWSPPPILPNLSLGEAVRFYGFPLGMNTSRGKSTVPVPLVKQGIISGFYGRDQLSEDSSFWIDGPNNPGFSGGPVVSIRNGVYSVSGVISGYRYYTEPVLVSDQQQTQMGSVQLNTGIILAENISGAMDIISKHGQE